VNLHEYEGRGWDDESGHEEEVNQNGQVVLHDGGSRSEDIFSGSGQGSDFFH
jgi:hypothetical protein